MVKSEGSVGQNSADLFYTSNRIGNLFPLSFAFSYPKDTRKVFFFKSGFSLCTVDFPAKLTQDERVICFLGEKKEMFCPAGGIVMVEWYNLIKQL